jgi:hypothetical protein
MSMSPRRKAVFACELFSIICTSAPSILEAAISSGMDDGVAGPAITSLAVRAGAAWVAPVGEAVGATVGCAVEHPAIVKAAVKTAKETTLFKNEGESFDIYFLLNFQPIGKTAKRTVYLVKIITIGIID